MYPVTSKNMVERLFTVINSGDTEQIDKIDLQYTNEKGLDTTIQETLQECDLTETVKATCCYMTPANLGHKNGASIFDEMLERKLLHLPCKHHMYEIIQRSISEIKIPSTAGLIYLFLKGSKTYGLELILLYLNLER